MKNINPDGLSDAEFAEAGGLAQAIVRIEGPTAFLMDLQRFAKRRLITRKQLEAVRRAWRAHKEAGMREVLADKRASLRFRASAGRKRPITLVKV